MKTIYFHFLLPFYMLSKHIKVTLDRYVISSVFFSSIFLSCTVFFLYYINLLISTNTCLEPEMNKLTAWTFIVSSGYGSIICFDSERTENELEKIRKNKKIGIGKILLTMFIALVVTTLSTYVLICLS